MAIRIKNELDDVVFDTRQDAESIVEKMNEIIDHYGYTTVADFYDLAGVDGSYINNKYGWTSIENASIKPVGHGYKILFPSALPIS